MKQLIFVIILICLSGCIREYSSSTATYIINETSHNIEIKPYLNGQINFEHYKKVKSNDSLEVFSANVTGKTLEPCFGLLLQPYDSVVIVFDGIKKSIHLKFNTNFTNGNYIWFDSIRSISNPQNYIKIIKNETKYFLEGYYKYIFTEQDYIDAQ